MRSDKETDEDFGYINVYGEGVERYIVSDIILHSHSIGKEIFKRYFYEKKYQYKTYWLKDTDSCISYAEICGGSCRSVPKQCNDWIIEVIHDYLINNEKAVVVFEDILYHISDEYVKTSELCCFEECEDYTIF